nr:hypothetical protein [Tanacetum cinerariifolium]
MQKNQDLLPKNRPVYAVPMGYAPSLINPNWSKVAWCLLGSDGEGDWKSWVRWWSGEKWGRWDSGVWWENMLRHSSRFFLIWSGFVPI